MFAKKVLKIEEKPIRDLSLAEIESELQGIPLKLAELKNQRDALAAQPLSRSELQEKVASWFGGVVAEGSSDLLSRLRESGFLHKVSSGNPDPGILTNGSSSTWQSNKVDSRNLVTIFSPLISDFLSRWIASLPEDSVGQTTSTERDSRLAELDLQRAALVERRNSLRSLLRAIEAASDAPIDLHALTRGGSPGGLDLERIEQKIFER